MTETSVITERIMYLITGASGGLGQNLAKELAFESVVIGTYLSTPPKETGNGIRWCRLDVTNSADIAEFVKGNAEQLRRVVLVNLAGISLNGVAHRLSEEHFDRVIATNLKGSFLMCRALLPIMRTEGWGRIINISSVVSEIGVPGTVAYASSKAALHAMTRTMAVENASKGVTVNALALGYFASGMMLDLSPDDQERIEASIPAGRLGSPAEVRPAIDFIVRCGYLTGATIDINGGLR